MSKVTSTQLFTSVFGNNFLDILSAIALNIAALKLKVRSDVYDGLRIYPFCVTKY
ncbi:hypothetical protein [Nostoc sp.]|uniref:hypothetical protein n=1 Tax=Nostoc sp. TaxID=1180 RepID=UPI002FFC03F6